MKKIDVYYFNELDQEIKNKVLANYSTINLSSNWIKDFENDLNLCGLEIYSLEIYNKKIDVLPLENEERIVNNLLGLFINKKGKAKDFILNTCYDYLNGYYKKRNFLFFANLQTFLIDYLMEIRDFLLSREQVEKALNGKLFTRDGILVN